MPHKIHDHFSKQSLAYLLELFGTAEVSYEVYQNLQVDVRFQPTVSAQELQPLGLLGRLVTRQALLEHFWNPPRKTDIRDCQLKLFLVQKVCYNEARRGYGCSPRPRHRLYSRVVGRPLRRLMATVSISWPRSN